MATTLSDIHSDIIQTNILPRLDGPSLSATATSSSRLQSLCSDHNLWSHVSKSTWPSITDPRVDDVISTFPAGHRSFFRDSFPSLITDVNHRNRRRSWSSSKPDCSPSHLDGPSDHPWPSELISAVDIRYQNDVIYSTTEFTNTTTSGFMTSSLRIELNEPGSGSGSKPRISRTIDLTVDEIAGADKATLSHLKESLTLNWILINPTRKRAGNLSSIKPVSARQDWVSNETILRYVTVLPGCDPNEMVKCRILVVLGVGERGVGLHVKEVTLKLQDLDCSCLNGRDFLIITQGAILEENNVKRRVVSDEERWKSYNEFKVMKKEKKEWVKREEHKRELAIKFNYVGIVVSFFLSVYFLSLLLK